MAWIGTERMQPPPQLQSHASLPPGGTAHRAKTSLVGERLPAATGPALEARQSQWLLAAALAGFAPMTLHLPQWLSLAVALVLLWHAAVLRRSAQPPPRWLLSTLAMAGALAIALHYQTLFGRNPGVALLALLFALKLLEMRARRDGYAVVLLNFFLLLSQFFYTQSVISALFSLFALTLCCMALLILNHPRAQRGEALRLSALMLAQAAPFMLFLFLLFPRISGPLWGLPVDANAGLTGLSDSMTPGSISALSQSDAIAFRVQFVGKQPPQSALYWRGPVLASFDGETWSTGRGMARKTLPYEARGPAIDYSVTLEAHGKPWLFALELPVVLPADAYITADYQLLAHTPLRSRLRYETRSYPDIIAGAQEAPARLREALELPPEGNPRARALAAAWRSELDGEAEAIVMRMLSYFRQQRFSYTLTPPRLGAQGMDDFLFDSRRGFCEHYAASFVFMMRAAGIPARVVTGYQGGEQNPIDGTLIVRQSDAHAWAEYWLKGSGWQRVDPTAAVAPDRIEGNLAAALPAGEPLPLLARPSFFWLHELRYRWDALGNAWNQRVLGYNPLRQRDFLQSLGMQAPDWKAMTLALTVLCSALLAVMTAWVLLHRPPADPAERAWSLLSQKLARRGLARRAWEGPQDYAARVAAAAPEHGEAISLIARLYQGLRYGRTAPADAVSELKTQVRKFKP